MEEAQRKNGMDLKPGQLFGERYRIVRRIGQGGMGCVYLAEDMKLGGKYRALKLTRPLEDEGTAFLREARLLSELEHPNLPAITDYYPPGQAGIACIVMDYVAGETLAQRLQRLRRTLPFREVLGIAIDLCDVLTYLHNRNPAIVFRDLKPANVMLDEQGRAILVDFGIARRFRSERDSDTLQLGTPGFAAPEQLLGLQSDPRTDLYGIGALCFHLLSGGQFACRVTGPIHRKLQQDVPRAFSIVLERLLAYDPADRPLSAEQLSEELMHVHDDLDEIEDRNIALSAKRRSSNVNVVAVLSAYPGAGATFAALALSSSMNRQGMRHALVECPGAEPELYSLLDGRKRMPSGAPFAELDGELSFYPPWKYKDVVYYPANPVGSYNEIPGQSFAKWLRRVSEPLVLLDVSSRWGHPGFAEWLVGAVDRIWMVVDCYPAKWSSHRQNACLELLGIAGARKVEISWLANRDQPFSARGQWLDSIPAKPIAILPQLDSSAVLHSLWRGNGFPDDKASVVKLDRAIHKLLL